MEWTLFFWFTSFSSCGVRSSRLRGLPQPFLLHIVRLLNKDNMARQVLVLVLPSDWTRVTSAPERCFKPPGTHPHMGLSELNNNR